ncbi:response regulator [Natribaculum luteum]|uniref:histidine kinase n=1 Tax=Natribaculum luteum TaxID=1586232 RepID=A0ABD5P4J4_9EURY|nr:response regulator [Natribaculum luteum]
MGTTTGTIRILHVDDDPAVAELTADFLEREDDRFTVETATSASEGVDQLDADDFDCIVSDYDMPVHNGIEFLETVREEDPELPFILFTGKGSEEVASEAISAGVSDYLQKGVNTEQYELLANRILTHVERTRAQRERKRHRNAIETARERISILDVEGHFVYVNEAYADLYGYDPDEMIGHSWELTYPDDEIQEIREEILPTVEETGFWRGETIGLRADGSTFVEDHSLALTDEGEFVCTIRDVTEHQECKHKLQRSNALLSTLFEALPAGVLAEDESRTVLAVNQQMVELFEIPETPDEVIGEDCERMVEEVSDMVTDPDEFIERIDELADEPEPVHDEELVLQDSRVLARSHEPIDLPDGEGNLWVYRGISEQEHYQERLEQLYQRTRTLMHTSTTEETAQVAVDAAQEILGAPTSGFHLVNDDNHVLEPIAFADTTGAFEAAPAYERGADSDPISTIVWDLFESGDPLVIEDTREHGRIAAETPARSGFIYPLDDHGVFIISAMEPHAFDDTDTTLVEILIALLTAALDRAKRETLLREREHELERQNNRLDEFASVVSHDLRNPLNVAHGRLELAMEECESEHLDHVARAHERMVTLIDDLLTLAREGAHASDREVVHLEELSVNCWQNVDTADATLTTETTREIQADRSRLQQLLENLMRNAVEHGGDVTVTVGELDDGFYVEDDGPGIPEEARADVFKNRYSTSEDGTGLGLGIVTRVVEAHDWGIRVTEGSRSGARFEITNVEFADK